MLFGISLFSLFLTGCGDTKTKEEVKEEVKTEVKKEMEVEKAKEEVEKAKEEVEKAKEEAEQAKEEANKAKEEAEQAKEEADKAKEEAGKAKAASTKKAKAATKEFTARVTVSKMPIKDRKARFQKAAEAQLKKLATKAGYGSMIGGIQWVDAAPKCPKDKCMRKAKANFKK